MIGRRELLFAGLAIAGSRAAKCAANFSDGRTSKNIVRTVQDLVEACRSGGNYAVMPGTYVLGDKVLRPVSGTRITGTPGRTILQKRTSPGPYRTRAFFDIEDGKDVTIEGLVFDHHAARTEHAVIVRATRPAASRGLKMLNNVYRQCHVQIERFVEDVTIRDCRFLGGGVALAGISTGGAISKANGKSLNLSGAVRTLILENLYFERTLSEAIDINWHTHDVRARNITCYNCDIGGVDEVIDIGGDIHTTPANECRNIRFANVSIKNDAPGPTRTVAVHVKGRSHDVAFSNLRIFRRNEVGSGSVGVRVWNSDSTTFHGLVVDGCAYGILSTARGQRVPRRLRLIGATVRNYRGEAIKLEGDDCVLDGFEIDGTGSKGRAMDLLAFTNSTVRNGKISSAGGLGVRVQSSCSRVVVDNVTVSGAPRGKGFDVRGQDIRMNNLR